MRIPRFIRRVADPVTMRIPVPIASGVNRGLRWSLASAGHGYASGRRAARQMALLARLIRPGDVVWDVGAHHGYVTLCAARRVGPGGRVHAFEPSAANREVLGRHVGWNRLSNVVIHPYALSSEDGEATFGGSGTSKTFSLGRGSERVPIRRADGLIASGICPAPTFAKIDVEGAEADLLRGALPGFRRDARLFIAMHNERVYRECTEMLAAAGYEIVPSAAAAAAIADPSPWPGDPDVYCIGPAYERRAEEIALLREHGF